MINPIVVHTRFGLEGGGEDDSVFFTIFFMLLVTGSNISSPLRDMMNCHDHKQWLKRRKWLNRRNQLIHFGFQTFFTFPLQTLKILIQALWCNNKIKIPVCYKEGKCYLRKKPIDFWVMSREQGEVKIILTTDQPVGCGNQE